MRHGAPRAGPLGEEPARVGFRAPSLRVAYGVRTGAPGAVRDASVPSPS